MFVLTPATGTGRTSTWWTASVPVPTRAPSIPLPAGTCRASLSPFVHLFSQLKSCGILIEKPKESTPIAEMRTEGIRHRV